MTHRRSAQHPHGVREGRTQLRVDSITGHFALPERHAEDARNDIPIGIARPVDDLQAVSPPDGFLPAIHRRLQVDDGGLLVISPSCQPYQPRLGQIHVFENGALRRRNRRLRRLSVHRLELDFHGGASRGLAGSSFFLNNLLRRALAARAPVEPKGLPRGVVNVENDAGGIRLSHKWLLQGNQQIKGRGDRLSLGPRQ